METRSESEAVLLADIHEPLTTLGERVGILSFGHEENSRTGKIVCRNQIFNFRKIA